LTGELYPRLQSEKVVQQADEKNDRGPRQKLPQRNSTACARTSQREDRHRIGYSYRNASDAWDRMRMHPALLPQPVHDLIRSKNDA
jgi:hypothetical protein